MRRALIVVAAVLALLTGGCGIPENSDVIVLGPAPTNGPQVDGDSSPPLQALRQSATAPDQLVDYYLKAAAGEPESAVSRVRAFMANDVASAFKPGPDVRVIRLVEDPLYTPGDPEITVRAEQVGKLKNDGELEPATPDPGAAPTEYKLRVSEVPGRGYFLTRAPSEMLLTDTALKDFYQRRTIYFWNTEQTALVPDMRYMPRATLIVQQPTRILGWLANGPASWLSDRVLPLPQGTVALENVPAITNDTLQVTLNANAVPPGDAKQLELLRKQLQWSLRSLLPGAMELKIGHQDSHRYSDLDYLGSNPAYRLAETPERFVLFNGVVRRLIDSSHGTDPVPVLRSADNRGIVAAAMSESTTHTFAAVVTGSGKSQRLRVASAPGGEQSALKDVVGLSGPLGRPVWAVTADRDPNGAIGLITANGRLYSFSPDGSAARPVEWQGAPGAIQAIAVAPDERRVAMVAGGRLYRTVLGLPGEAVTLSTPQQLKAPTLNTVAAVAWSAEDWLVVAGVRADRRVSIMDLTIDGALRTDRLPDIGDKTVSYLTAYPSNPVTGRETATAVSYTAAGSAWDALSTPVPIVVSDLAGSTGNPPAGLAPTAPFFLD